MNTKNKDKPPSDATTLHIQRALRHDLGVIAAAKQLGVGELAEQVLAEYLAQPEHARVLDAVRAANSDRRASDKEIG